MGLGLTTEASSGSGDILPFVKYDSRAGRLFRNDRVQDQGGNYSSTPVDITRSFKAVVDMENVEVGWMLFSAGAAPQMNLVVLGQPLPPKPDPQFKQGVRLTLKLGKDCGNDVREISGNSASFLRGVDKLHDDYVTGEKENPGKLPIVVLKDTISVTSGSGERKSTNYQPVFEIVGWAPRSIDLVPRAVKAAPSASAQTGSTPRTAPPETGSTKVEPPAAKQPEPADADDFG